MSDYSGKVQVNFLYCKKKTQKKNTYFVKSIALHLKFNRNPLSVRMFCKMEIIT